MANYKESSIAGTSYVRAREVFINNPREGTKYISFNEEKAVILGDGSSVSTTANNGINQLTEVFEPANYSQSFPLLDINGDPTGQSMTYMELYLALQSLYYFLALRRDAAA